MCKGAYNIPPDQPTDPLHPRALFALGDNNCLSSPPPAFLPPMFWFLLKVLCQCPPPKGAITLYANRAMHILLLLSVQDKARAKRRSTQGPMNAARGLGALSLIFTSEWRWFMALLSRALFILSFSLNPNTLSCALSFSNFNFVSPPFNYPLGFSWFVYFPSFSHLKNKIK